MVTPSVFPLDAIRTDGWFERIGETVGSFQALCDILGERFFAFSMITGARITALTVDRRSPDNTLVDFVIAGAEDGVTAESQRLTLADFRRRLVSALVAEEPTHPPPTRPTDTEAVQLHIGVRYLLLAPLYGYSLHEMRVEGGESKLFVYHDGVEEHLELGAFRRQIRGHVRQELERATRGGQGKGAIDLAMVADAERASSLGEHRRVIELLGSWPAPLTIFLRTPEGQMLNPKARQTIAKALGLLGSAWVHVGEGVQGEESLRLAVQYAGDSEIAGEIYGRLGLALFTANRPGEAIGILRRAANLGAKPADVWPLLASAFAQRGRLLAAFCAVQEARDRQVDDPVLMKVDQELRAKIGGGLERFEQYCATGRQS